MALALGAAAGVGLSFRYSTALATVGGWDVGALLLLTIGWSIIARSDAAETQRRAAEHARHLLASVSEHRPRRGSIRRACVRCDEGDLLRGARADIKLVEAPQTPGAKDGRIRHVLSPRLPPLQRDQPLAERGESGQHPAAQGRGEAGSAQQPWPTQ
jgi:hypothetical protein